MAKVTPSLHDHKDQQLDSYPSITVPWECAGVHLRKHRQHSETTNKLRILEWKRKNSFIFPVTSDPLSRHCIALKRDTPARKEVLSTGKVRAGWDQVLQSFQAPHEWFSFISPYPDTSKVEMYKYGYEQRRRIQALKTGSHSKNDHGSQGISSFRGPQLLSPLEEIQASEHSSRPEIFQIAVAPSAWVLKWRWGSRAEPYDQKWVCNTSGYQTCCKSFLRYSLPAA